MESFRTAAANPLQMRGIRRRPESNRCRVPDGLTRRWSLVRGQYRPLSQATANFAPFGGSRA